jgi:hypothetical protein
MRLSVQYSDLSGAIAIEGRLPHGMGVTRLAGLPAEWSRQYQMLGLSAQYNCGFELRLFEPKSPLPGNGISRAETKAPRRTRRFKDAIAETEPTRTIPRIRGYLPRTRKSALERECVVGLRGHELRAKHAVAIEPVSRE